VGRLLYRMNQEVRAHLARTSLADVWDPERSLAALDAAAAI
jgi:hypothetical protein